MARYSVTVPRYASSGSGGTCGIFGTTTENVEADGYEITQGCLVFFKAGQRVGDNDTYAAGYWFRVSRKG